MDMEDLMGGSVGWGGLALQAAGAVDDKTMGVDGLVKKLTIEMNKLNRRFDSVEKDMGRISESR